MEINGDNSKIPRNWAQKWTKEEDERLLSAISLYDQDWKKIAEAVGTRNVSNCFQRWNVVLHPNRVKGHWSKEEDDRLIQLIAAGVPNWPQISKMMEGRSPKQCRERWINYLDPSLNSSAWTEAEDNRLLRLQAVMGNHWASISKEIPGRSENAVRSRHLVLTKRIQKAAAPHLSRKRARQLSNSVDVGTNSLSTDHHVGESSTTKGNYEEMSPANDGPRKKPTLEEKEN